MHIRGLRWYICGLLFLVTFINYVDRVSLGAMAPLLQKSIGWDDAEFGWINFSFTLSYALMFPVAGRLLDKFGVRVGLAIGVVLWSVGAISHAFASTALGFAVARFVLGIGESTNFPACVKAVAEWFPKSQRSFATGIFNTGTNFAAMMQGGMMALAVGIGWQAAFVFIGVLGFVWLVAWLKFYRSPEEHPKLSPEEAALIREGQEPAQGTVTVPWPVLLRYREAWSFLVGKMLTDPVWWFYLTWLPLYLKRERDVTLTSAAGALAAIYLAADFGSILGGWFPGFLTRRGMAPGRARILTMLVCALGLPISACAVLADSLWTAVALISVATASHQAWSANMFTVASDAFPRRFVASVVGFGAMCGGIGGMFMNIVSGGMLQWLGSYAPLFVFAGVMHPLAWIAIRLLSGKSIREVNLETDLRTSFSPHLLGLGVGFSLAGLAAAGTVILNYDYVLSVTKNSGAAAAGGIAAGGILVIMGIALIYACRAQRVGVVEGGPSIIAH